MFTVKTVPAFVEHRNPSFERRCHSRRFRKWGNKEARQVCSMQSDEELMLSAGAGNLAAFDEIVCRHQGSAWNTAYRYLGDAADAEDIVQETFLRLLRSADQYRPTAAFRTYLYRIITRLCIDASRKKRPRPVADLAGVAGQVADPAADLEAAERTRAVRCALDSLPPNQRMATVLRYYEGLSHLEIGEAMDTTAKAVERMLTRARATLETLLGGFLE
jgi:RNA polymerase sigma-70 factor (ECF subfamily)